MGGEAACAKVLRLENTRQVQGASVARTSGPGRGLHERRLLKYTIRRFPNISQKLL